MYIIKCSKIRLQNALKNSYNSIHKIKIVDDNGYLCCTPQSIRPTLTHLLAFAVTFPHTDSYSCISYPLPTTTYMNYVIMFTMAKPFWKPMKAIKWADDIPYVFAISYVIAKMQSHQEHSFLKACWESKRTISIIAVNGLVTTDAYNL